MKLEYAAKQLEAMGNPTRLAVYRLLIQLGPDGVPVGQLQKALAIPASTLSHHVARLVQAGLITQSRESRTLYCRADYKNMNSLIRFLVDNCCCQTCAPMEVITPQSTTA
ncbi:MAG: helix-turn-helix transcriptional regulator [Proteobacteria bacterium]|nr:helix-turn-helix transcriptional regulator [Pseudomonadota bacterium]